VRNKNADERTHSVPQQTTVHQSTRNYTISKSCAVPAVAEPVVVAPAPTLLPTPVPVLGVNDAVPLVAWPLVPSSHSVMASSGP
jgi:hypothetical protein